MILCNSCVVHIQFSLIRTIRIIFVKYNYLNQFKYEIHHHTIINAYYTH